MRIIQFNTTVSKNLYGNKPTTKFASENFRSQYRYNRKQLIQRLSDVQKSTYREHKILVNSLKKDHVDNFAKTM